MPVKVMFCASKSTPAKHPAYQSAAGRVPLITIVPVRDVQFLNVLGNEIRVLGIIKLLTSISDAQFSNVPFNAPTPLGIFGAVVREVQPENINAIPYSFVQLLRFGTVFNEVQPWKV